MWSRCGMSQNSRLWGLRQELLLLLWWWRRGERRCVAVDFKLHFYKFGHMTVTVPSAATPATTTSPFDLHHQPCQKSQLRQTMTTTKMPTNNGQICYLQFAPLDQSKRYLFPFLFSSFFATYIKLIPNVFQKQPCTSSPSIMPRSQHEGTWLHLSA